ncbi:TPA: hypothetical protein ACGO3Q_002046 [Streptococcus suis]
MLTVSSVAKTAVVTSDAMTTSSAKAWSTEMPPPTTAPAAIKPRNKSDAFGSDWRVFSVTFSEIDSLVPPTFIKPI